MEEDILTDDADYVETLYDDGSIEFDFDVESVSSALKETVPNYEDEHFRNLAEDVDDHLLFEIGVDCYERYMEDEESRADWLKTVADGIKLLGIELDEGGELFEGSCGASHPLILEAAVKFQAKASNELFSAKGPVKTVIMGDTTPEKEEQAARVGRHMNYQVMHQMEEYFDETETMLFNLPIAGSAFKKTYHSQMLNRPTSEYVPHDKLVVNYHATNLKNAPCVTHVIDMSSNDLLKDMKSGFYLDIDLGEPAESPESDLQMVLDDTEGTYAPSDPDVYQLLEQYVYLDIPEIDDQADEDGIALPYIVTIDRASNRVLSIRRNWSEYDETQQMLCPFTHYKFVPGLGFYGLGYVHLLGNLQITLTSTLRSLIDAGTFANMQGGFIDKRLRIKGEKNGPIAPGQFKSVEAGGLPLRDSIMTLPFKEPSQVLMQMYQFVEQRGQKFADSAEQVVADSTNYGPVGTTMALLEASTKFFSGVHKRLHKAQKHEFKILASLNYEYLDEKESYNTVGKTFEISKSDYDGRVDVIPVSDPNIGSQAQKLTLGQAVYTAALQNPAGHDMKYVSKYYYSSLGIDDEVVDKLVPADDEAMPNDPLSDIMLAQQGKPIKAFPDQDHESHVAIKSAFLQDPSSGANPMMAQLVPVIQANIQEHLILQFEKQMAGEMADTGQKVVEQAAQQVAQKNQRLAELEAQGPDQARNKLADAEVMRVANESRRLEQDAIDKEAKRAMEAFDLQLKKYAEDNKLLIAEMQIQQKKHSEEMKQMSDLLKDAMELQRAAQQPQTPVDKPEETE